MFNLFKKKAKTKTELDFFKQFLHADYEHFVKIHFPILIYPKLPSQPRNADWQQQRQYIIENLISETFQRDFETNYSNFEGQRFEIIEKHKNEDINVSKRQELVHQFLENQPKIFLKTSELNNSDFKIGDFNVFRQHLDDTPEDILKLTLESIHTEFPNSQLTWRRFTEKPLKWSLNELLKDISDVDPLNHLDRIYDEDRKWELLQPEENSFLLLGTNAKNLIEQLKQRELEIEIIEN